MTTSSNKNEPKTTATAPSSEAERIRGGGTAKKASAVADDAAAKNKKVRIPSFDAVRFILITNIVLGHFVMFAGPSNFFFRFCSQHNVSVGAFFALSGYMTAYSATENAKREPSTKLTGTPSQKWILSKIFGFYPLHMIVLLLFSPLFMYIDLTYNGLPTALWHGFLSTTLMQAWLPQHCEIWNAPTWFLSALSFATALMPFCLPKIAKMNKKQLRKTAFWTGLINFLPKLGYFYDFKTLGVAEGFTPPKAHPNYAAFNELRFNPTGLAAEILLGAIACRLVMLDNEPDEVGTAPKTNALSTLLPLVSILGIMYVRAAGLWEVSDMFVRSVLFIPLFLRFLMAAHRNTANKTKDPTVGFLSNKLLVFLGGLSFPIYIVHSPIGQMFYKKLVAKKLFGEVLKGPGYFGIYLATTLFSAWLLQKFVMQNKAIAEWSKKTVNSLSSWM